MENIFEKAKVFDFDSGFPVYDCRENCFMKYFENTCKNDVTKKIEELKSQGFVLLQEREIYGNYFAYLKKDNLILSAYFTPCDNTLRVTLQENGSIPLLEKEEIPEKCQSAFYCFENDHAIIDCGMCLIFQCCDYSFFIIDSGHYLQYNDNDRIYKFMRERTPEGQKIVISGWMITHAHSDHVSKLADFLLYNCTDVVIEGFYSNLLRDDYPLDVWQQGEENLVSRKFCRIMDSFPAPKYKIHSGMHFGVRNIEFDVLGTHEDAFPESITDYNDSSCVVMANVGGTRIFIPGDASAIASRRLEERYGENLRCDIAQVAHHGHFGLSKKAYELLSAEVLVFPITRIKFDEEYPRIEANRRAIEIADEYYISSDGTVKIPLPYKKGTIEKFPDESMEDFEKIKYMWGYTYTDERKQELYELFIKNGGKFDSFFFPVHPKGTPYA